MITVPRRVNRAIIAGAATAATALGMTLAAPGATALAAAHSHAKHTNSHGKQVPVAKGAKAHKSKFAVTG